MSPGPPRPQKGVNETHRAALAKGDAAAITGRRRPDPGLDGKADAVAARRGPGLLGALVVVTAVDADLVGGRGAGKGRGGEEDGGELHFGIWKRSWKLGVVCLSGELCDEKSRSDLGVHAPFYTRDSQSMSWRSGVESGRLTARQKLQRCNAWSGPDLKPAIADILLVLLFSGGWGVVITLRYDNINPEARTRILPYSHCQGYSRKTKIPGEVIILRLDLDLTMPAAK